MKKLILFTLLIMSLSSSAVSISSGSEVSHIKQAILTLHPKAKQAEVDRIAQAIKKVYADGTCTVPWPLVLSIAFHESTFRLAAVNNKSKDYGFMQISKDNIKRLRLDKQRLMQDYEYSLRIACKILTYNQATYSKKVSYWLGMYRSGNALWKENIRKNAISYDTMIRRTASTIGYKPHARTIAKAEK